MSDWTHALCGDCWDHLEPERTPAVVQGTIKTCCSCGDVTVSGIFYRAEPDAFVECDHDGGKVRSLVKHFDLLHAHVENLIERVYALEGGDDA